MNAQPPEAESSIAASLTALPQALAERDAGAWFIVNHSGGKDSQDLLISVLKVIPAAQVLVMHATLGDSEWPGALEHARQQAEDAGVPFLVAKSSSRDNFLALVEHRFHKYPHAPSFPQAANRQCNSDLKRTPNEREVRRYCASHGITRIVTCLGIRAAESSKRAKAEPWRLNVRQSVAGRTWHEWLPIHTHTTEEVYANIRAAGQELHPAYALGNERLSCVFCIVSSAQDLRNGAIHNPELYARYVEMERRTGYTLHMSRKTLPEITGIEP